MTNLTDGVVPHEFTGPLVNGERSCTWCSGTFRECALVFGPHCEQHAAVLTAQPTTSPNMVETFQNRVAAWMDECFTPAIKADRLERCDRFIEEALELVQTEPTFSADRAHALVDYVFGRPVGEGEQEVGGVGVTLAALCGPFGIDMMAAFERELDRITAPEVIAKIRAKQAAKPVGSALPVAALAGEPNQAAQSVELVDQLPLNYELSWGELDDPSEGAWQVHRVNGGRNDREWTLVATGETASEAIRAALQRR